MVWYKVATAHVRETENRLLAVAEAGALVIDPHPPALVSQVVPLQQLAEGILHAMQQRLGVREAYVFDRDRRILATTDTVRMDAGAIAPGLANYTERDRARAARRPGGDRALQRQPGERVPVRDQIPDRRLRGRGPDPGGDRRDPWCGPLTLGFLGCSTTSADDDPPDDDRDPASPSSSGSFSHALSPIRSASWSRPRERMERGDLGARRRRLARRDRVSGARAREHAPRNRAPRSPPADDARGRRSRDPKPLGGIEIFAGLLRDEMDERTIAAPISRRSSAKCSI